MLLLFNKSGSLECAKVVVLKLGAIRFYIAESILNFQNYEKKDIVKIRVSKFHKKKKTDSSRWHLPEGTSSYYQYNCS